MTLRTIGPLLSLAGVFIISACSPPSPKGPARTLTTHPHVADRYARISLRELVDKDPVAVHREGVCESSRLFNKLGGNEAQLRLEAVAESIYAKPANRIRRKQIDSLLYGQGFAMSGPLCDSLNAIADREEPIALFTDTVSSKVDTMP